ncbi:PRMT5-domain-containing protein [Crepidotus variabilis]|uniref:PRMT5-domain-containing protein n=1 Tax=Crepidotus variabilis TaxID=179855 RepID=A0A9P6E368_9AGAR|nr:PRMT5-domain-containing protein [Crepidotus variabilis]
MASDENSIWDPCATMSTFLTLEEIARVSEGTPHPRIGGSTNGSGVNDSSTPVLQLLSQLRAKGYQRICMPLTTNKWKRRWSEMCLLPIQPENVEQSEKDYKEKIARTAESWRMTPGFKREEVTITRLDEAEGIVAIISEWLELDSPDDWVRHDAEIALQQELAYAAYLNIQTVILPQPRNRDHVASYARIVSSCLTRLPYISLSVRLSVYDPSAMHPSGPLPNNHPASPGPEGFMSTPTTSNANGIFPPSVVVSESDVMKQSSGGSLNATWEMWDLIRSMCDYNTRLTLTLDLSPALPTTLGVLSKWAAESVRHIYLPSTTFIANMKGYPVLPKPTQQFIRDSMIASSSSSSHQPVVILAGVRENQHSRGGEPAYSQYVRHLEKTSASVQASKKEGTVENFAQGYQDYLQAPLQPLMDNLPSVTYQTFEQDPVKYQLYEEAMYRAFKDHSADEKLVVCIAGAGRGPLVARCFNALARSATNATVIVVEKNPNAFVTLQQRQLTEWGDKVQLIFGDMRVVDVPKKADILVSELLGSFGDNELSPECLDGAMRFLKPTGISIPSSYTAHLAPLSSSKLYNEARSTKNDKSLETPYVVMFQAVNILSGTKATVDGRCGPQVQECWEFEHPRRDAVLNSRGLPFTNSHNSRSASLRFYIPHAGILHGLAGYFEAILYDEIGLSIHPHRKDQVSKDMLSWFPLFFPFREPLYLPSNSELQVSIWRLTNDKQVWYEWHAESFISMPNNARTTEDLMPLTAGTMPPSASFSSYGQPSPLIDLKELRPLDMSRLTLVSDGSSSSSGGLAYESVKIGHTSLHNPGGRSSWIGL